MQKTLTNLLNTLERIENKIKNNKRYTEQFIEIICQKYLIKKENIPNSYYLHQQKMILDNGYGHIELDQDTIDEYANFIIKEQKSSLVKWLNYIISNEPHYPLWFRLITIANITKIGNYNIKNNIYFKRRKNTVAPFVELNKEALSLIYSYFVKEYPDLNENVLMQILKSDSFIKQYFQYLNELNIIYNNCDSEGFGNYMKWEAILKY